MLIEQLDQLIRAVCPIDGIDSAGGINYRAEATTEQRRAAQTVMTDNVGKLGPASPRAEAIKQRLAQIDTDSIRALRAKGTGSGKAADDARLKELDDEAATLRAELAER